MTWPLRKRHLAAIETPASPTVPLEQRPRQGVVAACNPQAQQAFNVMQAFSFNEKGLEANRQGDTPAALANFLQAVALAPAKASYMLSAANMMTKLEPPWTAQALELYERVKALPMLTDKERSMVTQKSNLLQSATTTASAVAVVGDVPTASCTEATEEVVLPKDTKAGSAAQASVDNRATSRISASGAAVAPTIATPTLATATATIDSAAIPPLRRRPTVAPPPMTTARVRSIVSALDDKAATSRLSGGHVLRPDLLGLPSRRPSVDSVSEPVDIAASPPPPPPRARRSSREGPSGSSSPPTAHGGHHGGHAASPSGDATPQVARDESSTERGDVKRSQLAWLAVTEDGHKMDEVEEEADEERRRGPSEETGKYFAPMPHARKFSRKVSCKVT